MTIESISKIWRHQTTFEAAQKHEDQDQQEAYFFASQTWVSDSWHFEKRTCNGGTYNCWLNNFKNSCKNWRCHKTRVQHNRRIICWKSLGPKSYAEVFKCVHPLIMLSSICLMLQHIVFCQGTTKNSNVRNTNLFFLILCGTYITGIIMFWTDVPASALGRMSRPSTNTNFFTLSFVWVWLWYILICMGLSAFFI